MELVDFWDRLTLAIKRPRTPSERSDEDGHMQHPPSGKKGKGKGGYPCFDLFKFFICMSVIISYMAQ